jgi:hypothetical protein
MTRADGSCTELRVAFYGRVACDADGTAMTAIARQYEDCRRALPPEAITAVFYDVGCFPAGRRHPGRLTIGDQSLRRDGGLHDLLVQARIPTRRFDQLITDGPDALSRNMERGSGLLIDLDRAGIEYLFPVGNTVERATGLHLAIMRLATAACTEMRSRAARGGEPR